jgi:hypothetical protein
MGIVYRRIEIKDFVTNSMTQHFDPAFAFMDEVRSNGG